MKAQIVIPKGFRRLRRGEEIRINIDRWFFAYDMIWAKCGMGGVIGQDFTKGAIFIRPIARKAP